jgi:hypothetical protein
MQVYLGDTPLDYRGIQLGDTNIQNVMYNPNSDAEAFINAAGITNPTEQSAIITLVLQLKGAGIWDRMYAIYPFVGGTANSNKYNLKNPQDTNAAFRLTFNGGWTYNSNGITGNGTNTYAVTHISPVTFDIESFGSIGVYSRTATANKSYDMGAYDVPTSQLALISRYTNGLFYAGMPLDDQSTITNPDGRGLFTACQNNGFTCTGYKNATQVINRADGFPSGITNPIYIGATYDILANSSSNKNYAFAFIGNSLNASQVASYYTIIQNFETTLGRQV